MLKRILLFVILLVVVLFGFQFLYDFGLKHNVNVKSTYVVKKGINADIVTIGTSNVLFTIVPDTFEKVSGKTVYNLATNHSSLAENLAHLHLYLLHNAKPKLVLLGISPADLSLADWTFHSYYFSPFMADSLISDLAKRYDKQFYSLSKFPFLKYAYYNEFSNALVFKGYVNWLRNDTVAYWPSGSYFYPLDTIGFAHFSDSVKTHHGSISYKLPKQFDEQLNELLSYLNKKEIQVILYETPMWQDAHQYFRGRDNTMKHIDSIAHLYNKQYLVFDTLALCTERKNFASVFHMKPKPAINFTKCLVRSFSNTLK